MAPPCREFGISRVTGYKIFDRYKECGLDGLHDRSKAPYRQANKLPFQVERAILGLKKEYPTWGAPKIRDKLIREYPMIPPPAVSTIHAALDRNGLVKRRKRRRYKACGTPLVRRSRAQRALVRRLQGRVPARQPAVLLPAHHHRLPLPLPARLRRPRVDEVEVRLLRVRAHVPRLRPPRRDPHRQRHALRRTLGDVRALPPGRLVAAPRDPPAAHQARQAAAERTPRAHAPHAQERDDQARRVQLPAAAGALRGLHPGLQPGAAAPGARRLPIRPKSIHPQPAATSRRRIPSTRSTIAPSA